MAECLVCGREARFNRGWEHVGHPGVYWVVCRDCRWEGGSRELLYNKCPVCKSKDVRDNHACVGGK